jgi:hypothetical protein
MLPRVGECLGSGLNPVVTAEPSHKRLLQPRLDTSHKGIEGLNAHLDKKLAQLLQ